VELIKDQTFKGDTLQIDNRIFIDNPEQRREFKHYRHAELRWLQLHNQP